MKLSQWIICIVTGGLIFLVSFYMGDMNFWPSLINGLIEFVGSVFVGEGLKKGGKL
ncbi:hypothetical protein AB1J05_08245 [Staphylococcus cohnii species complex 1658]|uniref:hypothetical protein n=1 Tax=Staphylococcus cohnii species complex 1658 TaxID=3239424 RepID=UPI0034D95735